MITADMIHERLAELRKARDEMTAELQQLTAELTAVHGAIAEIEYHWLPMLAGEVQIVETENADG